MKRLVMPLLAVAVVGFAGLGINHVTTTETKLQRQEVQLDSKINEAKQLKLDLKVNNQKLDEALQKSTVDQAEVEKLRQENEQLRQRAEDAEKQAAIRRENARIAAEKANEASRVALNRATGTARASAAPVGGGNCDSWYAALGLSAGEYAKARELQRRENAGCDPNKYNMGGSDACGVAQELPCGKSGCGMPPNASGACQVKWQQGYVMARYGSYAAAVAFHDRNNWY